MSILLMMLLFVLLSCLAAAGLIASAQNSIDAAKAMTGDDGSLNPAMPRTDAPAAG